MDRELILFFFFQAEDGIRDGRVTGVQTCALPIFREGDGLAQLAERLRYPLTLGQDASRAFYATYAKRAKLGAKGEAALRARDRKSVVWGKSVDLGGSRTSEYKHNSAHELQIIKQN